MAEVARLYRKSVSFDAFNSWQLISYIQREKHTIDHVSFKSDHNENKVRENNSIGMSQLLSKMDSLKSIDFQDLFVSDSNPWEMQQILKFIELDKLESLRLNIFR